MRKTQFPVVIAVILFVSFAAFGALGLVLAALGLFAAYFLSLRIHPRIRHTGWRSCNGSGEHKGVIFTWAHRKCPRCQGGRLIRLGAGHLGAPHVQDEYRRGREARARSKANRVWR